MNKIIYFILILINCFSGFALAKDITEKTPNWSLKTSISGYAQVKFENDQKDYTAIKKKFKLI